MSVVSKQIFRALPLALLAAAACSGDERDQDVPGGKGSPIDSIVAATAAVAVGQATTGPAADSAAAEAGAAEQQQPQRGDTARKRTAAGGAVARDTSAAPAVTAWIPAGRPKKDSIALVRAIRAGMRAPGWPVKGPAPRAGAILPNKRIVAYYGNPLSDRMGALGEFLTRKKDASGKTVYDPSDMLARLERTAAEWRAADPGTPVQPALHLIAVVAQGAPGKDGKYRLRMDSSLIEQVYGWARQRNMILFLDIQTGQSTIQEELPRLIKFLERPDVHLGIDPEFNMHGNREGVKPGAKIGQYQAADINYVTRTLADLVERRRIPPKVFVIHRFTRNMIEDSEAIKLDPRVQIVMHMDGWGQPWLKYDSYKDYIVAEPVQYAGFKLFYKNDTKKGDKLLTAKEVNQLVPKPLYIQYQ